MRRLALLVLLAACDVPVEQELAVREPQMPQMLPAYPTADELAGGKRAWDPRDQDPDTYGFTAAPGNLAGMPAEFESVNRLYIGWAGTSGVSTFLASVAAAASEETQVVIVAPSQSAENAAKNALANQGVPTGTVSFLRYDLDSVWMRDYGPQVARTLDGERHVIDARYYYGRFEDDAFPTRIAADLGLDVSRPPIEMEGGNFQSDGAGNCVTSERQFVRNAHLGYDAADIQSIFELFFGCEQTTIVPDVYGEGTGHVDMLVHITGPGRALVGDYDAADDEYNAQRLDVAAARLQNDGFIVTRIPMPSNDGGWVYRTYTNGLAVDGVVLVPVYDEEDAYEADALALYQSAYPDRTIVPVDADTIIHQGGAIHCTTMTVAD